MKNLYKLFSFLLITGAFTSCHYVSNPIQDVGPVDTSSGGGVVLRKVLLEDYTGHKCPNCPNAAVTAANLKQIHGKNLVVMAIHAGFFAKPEVSTNFKPDFNTSAGSVYNSLFGIPNYPNGLINRKNYSSTSNAHIFQYDDWASEVAIEIAKPANAKIEMTNNYNATSKVLTCDLKTTFLSDTLTGGPYRLIVTLLQDSILSYQSSGNVTIPNYNQMHVLRDNLNGTWGEIISNVPVTKNSPITKTYNYTLKTSYPSGTGASSDTNCNPNHCHIVAFLYNDATKEVIQVEEKAVTH